MAKTYTPTYIRTNYLTFAEPKSVPELLAERGVKPISELEMNGRTYRSYGPDAIKAAKAILAERGNRAALTPAPTPVPAAPTADLAPLLAAQEHMAKDLVEVKGELEQMKSKIDKLLNLWLGEKELGVSFDDAPHPPASN